MATDIDIAWAAGLFEGEGSATISSGQRQPRVSLQMTDEDVVRRFADIMGCGKVRHYPRSDGNKDVWQWSAQSGKDVLAVLGVLWPFLGERRQERATRVIEVAARIGESRGFCKRGHDLNDPAHLYVHRKTGKRRCRTCRIAYGRERRLWPAAN